VSRLVLDTNVVFATFAESECRDPDDLAVLGTCTSGNAEYLVTGDKDLLTFEQFEGTRILTPRAFYEDQA
jgi:predicted nucleic acid-binding protein